MITIEIGKTYKMRNGQVAIVTKYRGEGLTYPFITKFFNNEKVLNEIEVTVGGRMYLDDSDEWDLIEEVPLPELVAGELYCTLEHGVIMVEDISSTLIKGWDEKGVVWNLPKSELFCKFVQTEKVLEEKSFGDEPIVLEDPEEWNDSVGYDKLHSGGFTDASTDFQNGERVVHSNRAEQSVEVDQSEQQPTAGVGGSVEDTLTQRASVYGSFATQVKTVTTIIQAMRKAYKEAHNGEEPEAELTTQWNYLAIKMSRMATSPTHSDNAHDLAGYATLIERLLLDKSGV